LKFIKIKFDNFSHPRSPRLFESRRFQGFEANNLFKTAPEAKYGANNSGLTGNPDRQIIAQ
jgi:hypothetical protein